MSVFTKAEQIFPIYKVEHDCMVSVQGDLTVAYEVTLPEIFTLSDEDYETYHQSWIRAVKVLPKHSIVHKQDIFIRKSYSGAQGLTENFLTTAADRHFKGRAFLDHTCYLMLTKKADDRKQANSGFSGIMRKSVSPKQTTDASALPEFLEKTGQFEHILCDSGFVKLRRLGDDEISGTKTKAGLLEQYCFLQNKHELPMLKDIHLKDRLQIGDQHAHCLRLETWRTCRHYVAAGSPMINSVRIKPNFP
jgi:hypothetical protein